MNRVLTGSRLSAEASPIDIASLARHTAGDRRLGREILALFREQLPHYLEAFETGEDQSEAWRDAAHRLKGAARSVGANRVADLAERAEQDFPPPAERRKLLETIRRAAQDTRRFIDYQLLDSAH